MTGTEQPARVAGFTLSRRDLKRLEPLHPDLVRVVTRAALITWRPFVVLEGLRTLERQKELVAGGKSRTMKSRHLTGHAVDLAPYADDGHTIPWNRWDLFHALAAVMKEAARLEAVVIECGADWVSFPDGPHYQLPRDRYPAEH